MSSWIPTIVVWWITTGVATLAIICATKTPDDVSGWQWKIVALGPIGLCALVWLMVKLDKKKIEEVKK
jgi:hypothetical protein